MLLVFYKIKGEKMEIQILIYCFINTPIARIDNVSFVHTFYTWKEDVNDITNQDIVDDVRNRTKLDIDLIAWEIY